MKIDDLLIEGAPNSVSKVVTLGGTVQSGRFKDHNVTIVYTAVISDTTACLNNALTSMSGLPVLTFTAPL